MKTNKRYWFLTLALALNLSAKANSDQSRLMGTWDLKDFVIISKDGDEAQFCSLMSGKIIYERSGGMSASINCTAEETTPVPADQYGGKLFYAANFQINGDLVTHQVTNASEPSIVGKKLIRKVETLTDQELVLTGPLGEGSLRIVWTRPAPAVTKASKENLAYLTHLKLKAGTQDAFIREVSKIVDFSRSEPGNIAWFVQQSVEDPTEIVFYTRWANQAAIEWHLSAPPLVNYIQKSGELLAQHAKLVKYRPLDLK